MWILLTVIAASAVAGAALLVPTLWPVATLGGLLGLVALLLTWPVGPFLLLQAAALTNHYAVEVGPVSVRAEHVATIVVGVLLVLLLWRKKRPFLVTPAGWFALAWWSMNVLATIVNAVDPRDSVRHIIRLGLMVATYLIVINLLRTPRAWRIAAAGFLTLGALEAAYGLLTMVLYQLGFDLGLQVHRHIPIPIPYGTLQEGNLFGSHSASWALAFMWLVLARWRSRLRWWFVIGLALTLAATLFSFARGAWLAIGVSAVVVFVFYGHSSVGRWRRVAWVGVLIPIALLLVIGVALLAPADFPLIGRLRTFGQLMSDATFAARLDDYKLAASDWLQHPWIGWGPGAFFQLHGLRRWEAAWISNLTLRTLHETGAFGLLFFVGFAAFVLVEAITAARHIEGGDRALLLGLALGFFALLLAYQATDGVWLAAVWVNAGLLASGALVLPAGAPVPHSGDSLPPGLVPPKSATTQEA
jgi:O-antigen ligase